MWMGAEGLDGACSLLSVNASLTDDDTSALAESIVMSVVFEDSSFRFFEQGSSSGVSSAMESMSMDSRLGGRELNLLDPGVD